MTGRSPKSWAVFALGICSLFLAHRSAWAQVAFCKNASGTGTFAYTLSLPATSGISNSTQLLSSIPNAVAVLKFNRLHNTYWRWMPSSGCAEYTAPPFLSPTFFANGGEPGASPFCFKVNPGEGFVVVANGSTQYPVSGSDTQTVFNLQAAQPGVSQDGTNLISLRYSATAADAQQLMNDIGFSQVINVQHYVATSDTIQVYTGRMGTPPNFPLVPGEAYWVRMNTSAFYVPSVYGGYIPTVCSTSPSTYFLSGSASTSDFSFALLDGAGALKCWSNCAPLTNGGNANQIALDLRAGINAACSTNASASSTGNSVTISTPTGTPVQDLKVGSSDCPNTMTPVASCQVALAGSCTFNPTIILSCGTDGSACDDHNGCSHNDTCVNGLCAGTCYCTARPTGMVGWWPGDGNANDISGGGHNGNLLNGATTAAGQVGQAFSFDGTNDLVQVPGYLNTAPISEVTVVFWQRVNTVKIQSTFSAGSFVNGSVFNAHVPYNDGKVYWDFGNITTGGRLSYTPPASITGSWQHFALVASQAGNAMRIYRNGVKEAEKTGMTPLLQANLDLDIGGAGGISFGGLVDEFAIFNRALTDAEIQAIYDAGAQGVCKLCTDGDGDGSGLAGETCPNGSVPDCAPGDPSLWDVPGNVAGFQATKVAQPGTIKWSWSPATGGALGVVRYDVGRDIYGGPVCVLNDDPGTDFTESAIPAPFNFYIFTVSASDPCGQGPPAIPSCP